MLRTLLGAALAIGLAGCYETPRPECAFFCGPEGECPDGYVCRTDGWCKRDDVPANTTCAPAVIDASAAPDAPPAPPDASGGDGGAIDASVPDASVPDAAVPDAAVPDAAAPDAAVPDAAVPDAAVDAAV